MKNILLIFTSLLFIASCSSKSGNCRQDAKNSDNESYWESFPEATLPKEYSYTFVINMGGGGNIDELDSIFYNQYLSHEAISRMVQNYFIENYPELPLLKYYDGGQHNSGLKIGRLCFSDSNKQHILASFSFSNQKWFHRYLFILVFNEKELREEVLVAGECYTRKGEVPAQELFAYEVNGVIEKTDKGVLVIKRRFIKLASKEYRHVSQGVGKVLETFKDSTEVEIR